MNDTKKERTPYRADTDPAIVMAARMPGALFREVMVVAEQWLEAGTGIETCERVANARFKRRGAGWRCHIIVDRPRDLRDLAEMVREAKHPQAKAYAEAYEHEADEWADRILTDVIREESERTR